MLTSSYKNNLAQIKNALRSDKSFDLVERDLFIGGRNAAMFFVDGFIKDDIAEKILEYSTAVSIDGTMTFIGNDK